MRLTKDSFRRAVMDLFIEKDYPVLVEEVADHVGCSGEAVRRIGKRVVDGVDVRWAAVRSEPPVSFSPTKRALRDEIVRLKDEAAADRDQAHARGGE